MIFLLFGTTAQIDHYPMYFIVDIVPVYWSININDPVSPGALIVYAAILNQKLASSLQKKSHKRKKRPKLLDEVELQYVHCIKVRLVGYQ